MFSIRNGFDFCSTSRPRATCIPTLPSSHPIQRRLSFSAATSDVLEPPKKSATNPSFGHDDSITLSSSSIGFCVPKPTFSGLLGSTTLIYQTLPTTEPFEVNNYIIAL